jgi:hypothetical protein
MIDLIERIGPVVGIVAFVGLAVLAFLIFQQAREIRRLREWAGRAPERADDAAEASLAAAEARGEAAAEEAPSEPSRFGAWRQRLANAAEPRWHALDRRLPVDPRYLLVLLAAGVIAAGVLTSGFGLVGGDDGKSGKGGAAKHEKKKDEGKPEVAVLNATQTVDSSGNPIQGVPRLADTVASEVVDPAGYPVGRRTNAATGAPETVIMFEPDHEAEATALAKAVEPKLGAVEAQPMIQEVRDLVDGANLVIVVGQDEADF